LIQDAARFLGAEQRGMRRVRFTEKTIAESKETPCSNHGVSNVQEMRTNLMPSPQRKEIDKRQSKRAASEPDLWASSKPFDLDLDKLFDHRNLEHTVDELQHNLKSLISWT
jgi:hypothetical protein